MWWFYNDKNSAVTAFAMNFPVQKYTQNHYIEVCIFYKKIHPTCPISYYCSINLTCEIKCRYNKYHGNLKYQQKIFSIL